MRRSETTSSTSFREKFGLETVEVKQVLSGKCTEWEINGKSMHPSAMKVSS